MSTEDLPEYMKVEEVAAIFRVSKLTVHRWEKSGRLVPLRINTRGDRRYSRRAVLAYLAGLEKTSDV